MLPRELTTPLYNWVLECLQQSNMFYYFKSKDVSWEWRKWSRVIWNMKNLSTTHWQVGKFGTWKICLQCIGKWGNLIGSTICMLQTWAYVTLLTLTHLRIKLLFPIKNLVIFSKILSKLQIVQIITTLLQHVVGTECLSSTLSDI